MGEPLYILRIRESEHPMQIVEAETFPDGRAVDIWAYSECRVQDASCPIPFSVAVMGDPADYYETAFGTMIVSERLRCLWAEICEGDVQLIPAKIERLAGRWYVANVIANPDCIDYPNSIVTYYADDDPHRAGKPRAFFKLAIDLGRTDGRQLFRPRNWPVVTVVSHSLMRTMLAAGISGIEFEPVSR